MQTTQITDEELKKFIEKALQNPTEAQYILVLKTYRSEFDPKSYYKQYEIVQGEVKEVQLNREKVALIPMSIPVIIKYRESTPGYFRETIFVFAQDGWKKVEVTVK